MSETRKKFDAEKWLLAEDQSTGKAVARILLVVSMLTVALALLVMITIWLFEHLVPWGLAVLCLPAWGLYRGVKWTLRDDPKEGR